MWYVYDSINGGAIITNHKTFTNLQNVYAEMTLKWDNAQQQPGFFPISKACPTSLPFKFGYECLNRYGAKNAEAWNRTLYTYYYVCHVISSTTLILPICWYTYKLPIAAMWKSVNNTGTNKQFYAHIVKPLTGDAMAHCIRKTLWLGKLHVWGNCYAHCFYALFWRVFPFYSHPSGLIHTGNLNGAIAAMW